MCLKQKGISTRRGIMCAHREPGYSHEAPTSFEKHPIFRVGSKGLQESENAQDESILLPLFNDMTLEEQRLVVEALGKACETEKEMVGSLQEIP